MTDAHPVLSGGLGYIKRSEVRNLGQGLLMDTAGRDSECRKPLSSLMMSCGDGSISDYSYSEI